MLVYFFGGGFIAGDGSEPRYDGESMARKGIVAITVNYRLGVFGFMAHPELTKESPHHASGNYTLLDQHAALRVGEAEHRGVRRRSARVTIAGESAGSVAVSAQMVSPLSRDLIAGAIGESGSILGTLAPVPLAQAEEQGAKFAASQSAANLAALRAMPAQQTARSGRQARHAALRADDRRLLLPRTAARHLRGRQAGARPAAGRLELRGDRALAACSPRRPAHEGELREGRRAGCTRTTPTRCWRSTRPPPTRTCCRSPPTSPATASSPTAPGNGSTCAAKTGGKPVYRYYYARPRPAMSAAMGNATPGLAGGVIRNSGNAAPPPPARGAVHSAEIEYAMGNLKTNTVYDWTPDDLQGLRGDAGLLRELREDGQPERQGPHQVAHRK